MQTSKIFPIIYIVILVCFVSPVLGAVLIVDKWGAGPYKTIPSAINAASAGDTVVVYPGEYSEQIILNKNIVLEGSGYEYTWIRVHADPALSMSAGTVLWFSISSQTGDGIKITGNGAILSNCVVRGCSNHGVVFQGTSADIINCVVMDNQVTPSNDGSQIHAATTGLTVINTIVWSCPSGNSQVDNIGSDPYVPLPSILYCRTATAQGVGVISDDPHFISCSDLKLAPASTCIDTGKTDITDPDGTRSDMGYFGGTYTPTFPVVTHLTITVNPDGTVKVQGTSESRY